MKSPNKLLAAALLLLTAGCATRRIERYPAIPDYPADADYDTSASCFVPNVAGLEYMAGTLSDELKGCGYNVYGNEAFDRKTPVPPDFVVEPLRWRGTLGCHDGNTVVYVQIIVRVRRPAELTEDKRFASFGEKPRDFQAISRRTIGKRAVTGTDYTWGIADAMANMMRNPEFRKALQAKRDETRSAFYGFDMTAEEPAKPKPKRKATPKR